MSIIRVTFPLFMIALVLYVGSSLAFAVAGEFHAIGSKIEKAIK